MFSLQASVFESTAAFRLFELNLGLSTQTLQQQEGLVPPVCPGLSGQKIVMSGEEEVEEEGVKYWSEWGCADGEGNYPGVCTISCANTQTHTPWFSWVWFAVLVWCWGRFLHDPPPPNTHTKTHTPLLTHTCTPNTPQCTDTHTPHPFALRTRHSQHRHGNANRCSAPRWACPHKAERRAPPQGIVGNLIYDARGVADQ